MENEGCKAVIDFRCFQLPIEEKLANLPQHFSMVENHILKTKGKVIPDYTNAKTSLFEIGRRIEHCLES